jgi:putative oxidoreductase
LKRLFFHAENYSSLMLNVGLMVMRVGFGLTMAFAHGLGKIPPKDGFIGYLSSMGLPAPLAMGWMAGLSELVGGLFIAIGLATRWSAASLTVTMAVAFFMAHGADPFQKKELSLMYMITFLVLFLTGPGKFSIDGLINKK